MQLNATTTTVTADDEAHLNAQLTPEADTAITSIRTPAPFAAPLTAGADCIDATTGLLNRHGLLASLANRVHLADKLIAVHVDLEGLQTINHVHGYDQGDAILIEITDRLTGALPLSACAARVTDSEFVIVAPGDQPHGQYLSQRLVRVANESIQLSNGTRASLGARAGWVAGSADTNTQLLRHATLALRDAKEKRSCVAEFNESMAHRIAARSQTEIELRNALVGDEFVLHGQPIVDVFEDRVTAIDLLLRWQHPTRGLLAAGEFLDIAEEADFVDDVDQWVVQQLCSYAALTHPTLHFSVNLSMHSISKPASLQYILDMLGAAGVPKGRLHVDIAQTDRTFDIGAIAASTQRLTEQGVGVSIDRFGHGFASLASFVELSVTSLKLDRSLVAVLDTPTGRGIATAIQRFAQQRGLRLIGSGVETAEQARALRDLGCRYHQGYFYQRPAPLEEILDQQPTLGKQTEKTGQATGAGRQQAR